jgi:hypothetical protein
LSLVHVSGSPASTSFGTQRRLLTSHVAAEPHEVHAEPALPWGHALPSTCEAGMQVVPLQHPLQLLELHVGVFVTHRPD